MMQAWNANFNGLKYVYNTIFYYVKFYFFILKLDSRFFTNFC